MAFKTDTIKLKLLNNDNEADDDDDEPTMTSERR